VIPLSTNSGLIGWVPNCDTLHSLIRDYREKKKILLNLEHRIMLRVSRLLINTTPSTLFDTGQRAVMISGWEAGKVTAGLVESTGFLPPGL